MISKSNQSKAEKLIHICASVFNTFQLCVSITQTKHINKPNKWLGKHWDIIRKQENEYKGKDAM